MYGKCVCFVVLDLIIVTYSTPGRFHHDYHSGHDQPIWGQDWHGWGHDWYSGHTTQRAKNKVTTAAPSRVTIESTSSTTPAQPTKSHVEIRLGQVITTTDAAISQFTQAEQDRQTLEALASGPENTDTSVAAARVKAMPDSSSSQFVKLESLADQQTLQAFSPGPEDSETSAAAASVKAMPDSSSSQLVKSEALADQQTLQAFAPGPEDTETSPAAAGVNAIPDGSSSQFVKLALADQQTLQAFAPGPVDGDTLQAAASVKTMSDASSSQFVKAEANQQTVQAFAPGPEDGDTLQAAASVKTMPDASSSQFVKAEANQQTLQAIAPGSEDGIATAAWQSLKRLLGSNLQSVGDLTEQEKAEALYKAQSFGPDGEYENLKRFLDAATVKPEASGLEAKPDGKTSLWHVAVYQKRVKLKGRYDVVCGGSLVKEYIVVSAGHCFWSLIGVQLNTKLFRLAAGKIHPGYADPRDTGAQYSDVDKIQLTNMVEPCYQPDLAIVTLTTPFKYTDAVKPLCVHLRWEEEQQLKKGNFGTVASWAIYEDGECLVPMLSDSLHWLSLPFVERDVCQVTYTSSTAIGRNRICAGDFNNTTQCDIDSGNGLAFYQGKVPYLRGVTTDTHRDARCTDFYTRSFTDIIGDSNYLEYLLNHINDYVTSEECENLYKQTTTTTTTTTEAPKTDDDDRDSPGQQFSIQAIGASPVPVLEGTSAPAYQWHVGIYSKAWDPFMQICGGTLVKRNYVISAAHCFWDDSAGQQPASQFAVAAGKLYRPWNNTQDTYAQRSNVSRIILPVRFRGSATSFQDDIAILRLSSPFTYGPGVQPACLSFNITFERMQLQPLNLGKVLGWGLTEENGRPSQRLNYIDLPYVDVDDCFKDSEPAFTKFITSDKICAGDTYSGHALCRGDSGGGFLKDFGTTPYLHGVASTAAGNQNFCNAFALAALTSTYSHRGFIRENIPDIEKECADAYGTESYGYVGGTGNVGNVETGNVGSIDNVGTGNVGSNGNMGTGNRGSTPNVGTGNLGSTGNQGFKVIEGPMGNAVSATPVFSQLPYYPNHFVCNCNCKT